jgi:hypothetical protein
MAAFSFLSNLLFLLLLSPVRGFVLSSPSSCHGVTCVLGERRTKDPSPISFRLQHVAAAKPPTSKQSDDEKDSKASSILDTLKERPGTLIALPFVVLIGLDLMANIVFLTKRTLEYVAFGKLPSTEVWFSDNFFF